MPIPTSCTHIMLSGAVCQSPAVKGTSLCYHHSAVKTALNETPSRGTVSAPIPFAFAEDRAGLEVNYHLLLKAFNEHSIDIRTAGLMLRILRAMDHNLGKSSLNAEAESTEAEPPQTTQQESHPESPAAGADTLSGGNPRPCEASQQADPHQAEPAQPPIPGDGPAGDAPPSHSDHSRTGLPEPAFRAQPAQKRSGMESSTPPVQSVQFGG